jgi:hypothetical protein
MKFKSIELDNILNPLILSTKANSYFIEKSVSLVIGTHVAYYYVKGIGDALKLKIVFLQIRRKK